MAGYQLQSIPEDVQDFLFDEEHRLKKKFKRNISKERIIYRLIRRAKLLSENLTEDELNKLEAAG